MISDLLTSGTVCEAGILKKSRIVISPRGATKIKGERSILLILSIIARMIKIAATMPPDQSKVSVLRISVLQT